MDRWSRSQLSASGPKSQIQYLFHYRMAISHGLSEVVAKDKLHTETSSCLSTCKAKRLFMYKGSVLPPVHCYSQDYSHIDGVSLHTHTHEVLLYTPR